MIPTGVHGLEKFSSRKRTCSFDPSFGAGCRWPISARHLVTDRVRIRSARSSFVDAPRAAGSCLDDSDRGVHSRDGIPGTLLRSGNGRDVPYGQSNHLDCRRWIDLSGDALVMYSFDGSQRCANSCDAFADGLAICRLGLPATVHAAIVLLCAAGIAAGQPARSAGDHNFVLCRSYSKSHPDSWNCSRWILLLRNVPTLSEYLSVGRSPRDSGAGDGRQRFRHASASYARGNRIFGVSLTQTDIQQTSLRTLRLFLASFAVKSFEPQRTLKKRQDRGEKEDLSSRSRQPRFAERLDDPSQALQFD